MLAVSLRTGQLSVEHYRCAIRNRVGPEQQRQAGARIPVCLRTGDHTNIGDATIAQEIEQHCRDVDRTIGRKQRAAKALGLARIERT